MARIGSSTVSGPLHKVQLTREDVQRILRAARQYEKAQLFLSKELQDELVSILETYVSHRSAHHNMPKWSELKGLIKKPLTPAKELLQSLQSISARNGKSDREKTAMTYAEQLILAHHGFEGLDSGPMEASLTRLAAAIEKSISACERHGGEARGR
jgi:alkylhydroperoxidase family enzyme